MDFAYNFSNFSSSYQVLLDSPVVESVDHLRLLMPAYLSLPVSAALCASIIILSTYLTTLSSFSAQKGVRKLAGKAPPIIPYGIPFIGTALSFGLSPSKCVDATSKIAGANSAFGLKLLGDTIYFISGRANIAQIWRYKESITDPGVQTFCLVRVFGMAQKAVEMYNKDNSGIELKPNEEGKHVTDNNRLDYHTHANFVKMLSGDGLNVLFRRWHAFFSRRLTSMSIGNEWVSGASIEDYFMTPLTAALNEAMAGRVLENVNPNFTKEFIEFLPFVHGLMKGLPNWCLPRAVALRDILQRDFKNWHAIARGNWEPSDVQEDESDRWWGVGTMRERQTILGRIDNWDHDSVASSDFGLLWGANINVHTASIWTIVEIFKDPSLLARVREELDSINADPEGSVNAWAEQLMTLPLLNSVYSEVLRLRTEVQSVFRNFRDELRINEWEFPKESLLLVPTKAAHMDESFWNTRQGQHPVDRFWSDRFLSYPNDPLSGPRRPNGTDATATGARTNRAAAVNSGVGASARPKYVTAGTSDSWIPYGVGERTCPGKFFARREILTFCAMIVQNFEVELLSLRPGQHLPSNYVFYGLGVQRPRDALPFRIRRLQRPFIN